MKCLALHANSLSIWVLNACCTAPTWQKSDVASDVCGMLW